MLATMNGNIILGMKKPQIIMYNVEEIFNAGRVGKEVCQLLVNDSVLNMTLCK